MLVFALLLFAAAAALAQSPSTGDDPRGMAAFDRLAQSLMKKYNLPGGAIAVMKDGKLVFARGYGYANRDTREPVQPDSAFRVASLSKPITSAAVLKLVEEGKLHLDDKVVDILSDLQPLPNAQPDPRFANITVRELLWHAGGWNSATSFDPMFMSLQIAAATQTKPPAGPWQIARYMRGQPLQFAPGTQYAYSNFGYCVLGRVIEKITGEPYEKFVREKILKPIGITRMRIGASLDGKQAPGEVRYYTSKDELAKNAFPNGLEKVPLPYGGFHLEAMDAHGGWIASAIDLARFAAALNDPKHCPLKPLTLEAMYAPPPAPVSRKSDGSLESVYYGCGWQVRPAGQNGKPNYWHNGSLPGTNTWLVRRGDGLSWAMLFNQRSEDKKLPDSAIDSALHRAADAVEKWPDHDLFPQWQKS
jgi:N-acyl-D-amino-acid deacylase